MITHTQLLPGVTLHCCQDHRFKQNTLSLALCRPTRDEEAALNALLPAVLLRGCEKAPDLRAITLRLDDLYGAGVGALVRRVGDWQTTGFYCSFTEDRFAMTGDQILAPLIDFVKSLAKDGVKIAFNMAWVAESESVHHEITSYGGNQTLMYEKLTKLTKELIFPLKEIDVISPAGTAIQNARTCIRKKLTRDWWGLLYPS